MLAPSEREAGWSAPILSAAELDRWVAEQRAGNLSIGFTCGAFDILHAGHINYLQEARRHCDRLLVAVNSDESVRSYKGPLRPIIPEQQRMQVVAALSCVDAVTSLIECRPAALLERFQPDIYIKGGDYQSNQLRSASLVENYGGRVLLIPMQHQTSTTAILSRIRELSAYAEVSPAPRLLESPKIVFLDRDGTLIENVPFLLDPARVQLLPGVIEGLQALMVEQFILVVLTNQGGLGLGYFDYDEFVAVNSAMLRQLALHGIEIARFYFCPHSLADHCLCRKPGTDMLERALAHFGARVEDTYFIGDSTVDLETAANAGSHGILVSSRSPIEPPAVSFTEAVRMILAQASRRR